MKKLQAIISATIIAAFATSATAAEPDMIVTSDSETIKAYNLDVTSGANIYYTLTEDADVLFNRIAKTDVLIIKLADGTKLDPSALAASASVAAPKTPVNPNAHEPVTHRALTDFITDKKGNRTIHVGDGKGQILNMRLVPDEDKTLSVAKWDDKGKYDRKEYIIPEYVDINGDIYTVRHIDEKAFKEMGKIVNVTFPSTLKTIGKEAFYYTGLQQIVLPDGLEEIGEKAFSYCAFFKSIFKQLYIPTTIKEIGEDAFRQLGPKKSYNGFFQGNLTSIPDWLTTGNCTQYGIDEEAIEAYEKRQASR